MNSPKSTLRFREATFLYHQLITLVTAKIQVRQGECNNNRFFDPKKVGSDEN